MAFFDKLGETISSKSKDVAKKAKDFAEVTKLNSQISTEEDAVKKIYEEIGRSYFEQNHEHADDPFAEQMRAILEAQERVEGLKAQIQNIKGVRACPSCGAEMPFQAQFCPACGTKSDPPELPAVEEPAAPEVKRCESCGAELPLDATFCTACGQKVAKEEPEPAAPAEGKKCPNCSAELAPGTIFCPSCGAKVE